MLVVHISISVRQDKCVGYMLIVYSDRHLDRQLYLGAENKNKQVGRFIDKQADKREGRHADRQTDSEDRQCLEEEIGKMETNLKTEGVTRL